MEGTGRGEAGRQGECVRREAGGAIEGGEAGRQRGRDEGGRERISKSILGMSDLSLCPSGQKVASS